MADRKSLLSRFWPPPSSRRTSTTKSAAPPPATTTSTPSTKPTSRTSPTTAPPPRAASPPTPATPPRARTEARKDDQPNSASSPETSKSPSPSPQSKDDSDEPKISSPSRATTRSPPSSKPASPSRLPAQSRSPPQPSSPSHAAPQARSTPSTPKRASKPHSPSRITSRSPKQGPSTSPKGKQPASPSKESTTPTETLSTSSKSLILASKENDPKPAASQQEPETKEEVTTESAEVINGQTQEGKIFENGNATTTPAEGNQTLYSSSVNDREELDAKAEETKDVKEVMQARNNEAIEETKKEIGDTVTPTLTVEKPEIPSEADHIHREKPEAIDTKEISDQIHRKKPETISTKKISATMAYDSKSAPPNGERVPLYKNIRADVSKFANQMSMGDPKRAITDSHVSVITLAGENRGASMQMESDSSKREGPVHIHRSYKISPDDSPEATTDGEEISQGKRSEDERSTDDQLTEAYVNNNAQGINNSIVFNSSVTEGSPGVHMVVNHLPKELIQSKDKISSSETRKAEVNTSRAEKLTYQPTVRRRCLRGLLLETSDSDPENPEKPRRHGCRVGCQKEDRENNIDVL